MALLVSIPSATHTTNQNHNQCNINLTKGVPAKVIQKKEKRETERKWNLNLPTFLLGKVLHISIWAHRKPQVVATIKLQCGA
jgi:hypothetical protein